VTKEQVEARIAEYDIRILALEVELDEIRRYRKSWQYTLNRLRREAGEL
jgi:hypothetical protein